MDKANKECSSIRKARITDWPCLYHMFRCFFTELNMKQLTYIISNSTFNSSIVIYEKDQRVIGAAKFNVNDDNMLWLDYLIIAPEFRRMGLASCMLDYLEEFAFSIGADKIGLAVLINNQNARSLYKKSGYTETEQTDDKKMICKKKLKNSPQATINYSEYNKNISPLIKLLVKCYFPVIHIYCTIKRIYRHHLVISS